MAKKTQPAKPEPKAPEQPLVLGVAVRGELADVPILQIDDPPGPPDRIARSDDAEQIAELARSIREVGQVQPVMVEKTDGPQGGSYVRVFGRRRIAAAKLAGLTTVRAIVVPPLDAEQRRTIVAVENIQRKNLTPIEEHLGVWDLCEMQALMVVGRMFAAGKTLAYFGHCAPQTTILDHPARRARAAIEALKDHRVRAEVADVVAGMLAKSPTWVRDRMYIGRLSKAARQLVLEEKLPLQHAREIAKVGDEETRDQLAADYAAGGELSISETEPGKLDELRESVGRRLFSLAVVPWKLDAQFAEREACTGCPHNSTTNPGLFDHGGTCSKEMRGGIGVGGGANAEGKPEQEAGVCTNHVCYEAKIRAARAALSSAAKRIVDKQLPTDAQVEILKPGAIKKRAEERKAASKSRPKSSRDLGPSPETAERRRREAAEGELQMALVERAKETEKKILSTLAKKPGQWAMVKLLMKTKDFEATHHWDRKKACKAAEAPGMKTLLSLLATPSWENLLAIEQQCGRRFGLLDEWKDGPSGMADALAKSLGIELDAPPTLEDFLKEKEPEAAKASKPAKKRAARSEDEDDAEDEE